MANETLALVRPRPSDVDADSDYESFCAAVGASARGRAFLTEYARRNRHADTQVLLAALNRLELLVQSQKAAPDTERIRRDLVALYEAIGGARAKIDDCSAAGRAAKLAALIQHVEHRIEAIIAGRTEDAAARDALPVPSPANDEPHPIALVLDPEIPRPAPTPPAAKDEVHGVQAQDHAPVESARAAATMPEVNLFDGASVKPAPVEAPPAAPVAEAKPAVANEPVVPDAAIAGPAPQAPQAFKPAKAADARTVFSSLTALIEFPAPGAIAGRTSEAAMPIADPLAAIMALSEAERIALFT